MDAPSRRHAYPFHLGNTECYMLPRPRSAASTPGVGRQDFATAGSIRSVIGELSHCCVASNNAPGPQRLVMFYLLLYTRPNAEVWDNFSLPSVLCRELKNGVCFRPPPHHCRVPFQADGLRPPAGSPETVGPTLWPLQQAFPLQCISTQHIEAHRATRLAAPLACSTNWPENHPCLPTPPRRPSYSD